MLFLLLLFVEMYSGEEGLKATFQFLNFIGWSPDPSQVNHKVNGQAVHFLSMAIANGHSQQNKVCSFSQGCLFGRIYIIFRGGF